MQSYILSPACKVPRAPDEPLGLLGGVPPLLEEPRMSLEKDGDCFIVCFCGERMVRRYYELVVGNREHLCRDVFQLKLSVTGVTLCSWEDMP